MGPIIESGMTFGPYADEDCFYIEKSRDLRGSSGWCADGRVSSAQSGRGRRDGPMDY